MNRACLAKNTNLHEQNQHVSSLPAGHSGIRPNKNNFIRIKQYHRRNNGNVILGLLTVSVYAQPPKAPNVVFVQADELRAQDVGYNGNKDLLTPNLDLLAGHAINFTNTISTTPVSCPYWETLLTGQYPLTHGVFVNDVLLNPDAISPGKSFKAAGYETADIGKWYLDGHGRNSFIPEECRQGFEYWKVLECTHDYSSHIPLMIRWPGKIQSGSTTGLLISAMDMMPSILGLMELKVPAECQDNNLGKEISNNNEDAVDFIPIWLYEGKGYRGVITSNYTFSTQNGATEGSLHSVLFDRKNDPGKLTNLFAEPKMSQVKEKLFTLTQRWMKKYNDHFWEYNDFINAASDDQ